MLCSKLPAGCEGDLASLFQAPFCEISAMGMLMGEVPRTVNDRKQESRPGRQHGFVETT